MRVYEAELHLVVEKSRAKAYKKMIENEQSRYWTQNPITKDGVTTDNAVPVWSGNNVDVRIMHSLGNYWLEITMVSRTLPNLETSVADYCSLGALVVKKNY